MQGLGTLSAGGWLPPPPILGNSPAVPLQGHLENRGTDASVCLGERTWHEAAGGGPLASVCVRERESQEEWREREGRG